MRKKDLTGMRFGRWTVIDQAETLRNPGGRTYVRWNCVCDCGTRRAVRSSDLLDGRSNSCGCLQKENVSNSSKRHGETKTRLYKVYAGMKTRCYNPNSRSYPDYGGRGIQICDEWRNDFLAFKKWAYENGFDPDLPTYECTIDRIDPNGGYCPENCRWVSRQVQGNNTRHNHLETYNGETHNLTEWAHILNMKPKYLSSLIHKRKMPFA